VSVDEAECNKNRFNEMETSGLPRRDFLEKAGLVTGAIAAGPVLDSVAAAAAMPTTQVPELLSMDAVNLARTIKAKQISCRTVMDAFLNHIDRINPKLNAIVSLQDRETLFKQADERDAQLARGEYLGWLQGFPQAIKDLTATKGIPTTQGFPLLRNFIPQADAFVVERMKKSGAIIIGKTNAPEFGLGSQTYNNVFGATLNAYDQKKTAGGSSGGAAVSVALHMQAVADGTDSVVRCEIRRHSTTCSGFVLPSVEFHRDRPMRYLFVSLDILDPLDGPSAMWRCCSP
jgi:amidase